MSRKTNTVEWFPHYANASSKMTITILEKKYGTEGYACWFKLLECLAQSDGHYIPCQTTPQLQYLMSRLPVSNGNLMGILQDMADLSAIDKELWNKHKVIWSDNFVSGIRDVYTNRKRDPPVKPLPTTNIQLTYLGEEGRKEGEEGKETTTTTVKGNLQIGVKRDVFNICEDNFQKLTAEVVEKIKDLISEYTEEKVEWAFRTAIKRNKKNLAYVEGILENNRNGTGRPTTLKQNIKQPQSNEQIIKENEEFRNEHGG